MNSKRGFKRIIFVLAIVAALCSAMTCVLVIWGRYEHANDLFRQKRDVFVWNYGDTSDQILFSSTHIEYPALDIQRFRREHHTDLSDKEIREKYSRDKREIYILYNDFWVRLYKVGLLGLCVAAAFGGAVIVFCITWLVMWFGGLGIYKFIKWLIFGFCEEEKKQRYLEDHIFLKGTLKITLVVTIVTLVLAGVIATIVAFSHFQKATRNRNLEETKVWEGITVTSLQNAYFKLFTKWRDQKLYYQFHVDGFPREVRAEFDKTGYNRNINAGFTIALLDSMGFKIESIFVPLRSMSRIVRDCGGYSGLSIKDTYYMSADEYRKAARWEISWSL